MEKRRPTRVGLLARVVLSDLACKFSSCFYFYRIDVSAKLDDEIQFQLTVFFAIVVDGDIAQCLHLAANEVLCEISLVGIFVVGQEQERSWSFIHRSQ